ncbi:hypothetical protein GOP47_0022993 [Adiantum capillus-veneris]|uniref:ATP-dependent (S)-NAD(P)H-hydrate dehydratase n=1 Tax=Adiantum capillus-veneris TaxID=13818 RepID=A0A9D4Z5V3_ADICA|nr:hypothetical protein GOP47_0022993 [Adiantum capillus-veneris]
MHAYAHSSFRARALSRLSHHLQLLSPGRSLGLQGPSTIYFRVRASSSPQQQEHKVAMANSKLEQIIPALCEVVPSLSASSQKGQAGKVAVIGGCREYTGAPFFSAISALKVGADLAHVFCTQGAATVIKSYSPEIIVHPILQESYAIDGDEASVKGKVLVEIEKWLGRFDCLIIGPGLGRDPFLLDCIKEVIKSARNENIPLILDGDGLFFITHHPDLVCGYPLAILTPNKNEHKHLVAKMMSGPKKWQDVPDNDMEGQLKDLAKQMGGLTIIQKGKADYISDGTSVFVSDFFGSPRRCGGQGDVLSGSVGVFMTWARDFFARSGNSKARAHVEQSLFRNPAMIASLGGSLLLRKAASEAYNKKKRSMVTTDIIELIGDSMEEWFPA